MVLHAERVFQDKNNKEKTPEQIEKEKVKQEKQKQMRLYQDLFSTRLF